MKMDFKDTLPDKGSENTVIVSILQDMGLTENEARVYMLLLSKGGLTAQDLLRNLSLRQPQLYDITSSLERKGFINVIDERPKKFEPLMPEAVIESREVTLRKNREFFLKWANNAVKSRRENATLSSARNLKSVINNTIQIISEAQEFLEIETTTELLGYFSESLLKKARSGIRILLLLFGARGERIDEHYIDMLDFLQDVRFVSPGQFFTVIADESSSIFMPRNVALSSNGFRYGYVIRDRDMSWFISHNFFSGWYKGMEMKSSQTRLPATYRSQRIAVDDISKLLSQGIQLNCHLEGIHMNSGKKIELQGRIVKANIDSEIINFIVESGGRTYSVGGYDSQVEDIQMLELRIY